MSGAEKKDLRIILVGKTGTGKSATGNTILGRDAFRSEISSASVTENCQKEPQTIGDKCISVIDTPGIFGEIKGNEMTKQIEQCVEMSVPGPHAFLLVIRIGRFTPEERNAVKWIQENFGEDALKYTIVLFTHADQLKEKPLHEFIRENSDLEFLIDTCGNRCLKFNNRNQKGSSQVTDLLKNIETMVTSNGGQHYTNKMFQTAQRKIKFKKFAKKSALGTGILVGGAVAISVGVVLATPAAVVAPAVAGGAVLAAKAAAAVPAVAGAVLAAKAAAAVPAVAGAAGVSAVVAGSGNIIHNENEKDK